MQFSWKLGDFNLNQLFMSRYFFELNEYDATLWRLCFYQSFIHAEMSTENNIIVWLSPWFSHFHYECVLFGCEIQFWYCVMCQISHIGFPEMIMICMSWRFGIWSGAETALWVADSYPSLSGLVCEPEPFIRGGDSQWPIRLINICYLCLLSIHVNYWYVQLTAPSLVQSRILDTITMDNGPL